MTQLKYHSIWKYVHQHTRHKIPTDNIHIPVYIQIKKKMSKWIQQKSTSDSMNHISRTSIKDRITISTPTLKWSIKKINPTKHNIINIIKDTNNYITTSTTNAMKGSKVLGIIKAKNSSTTAQYIYHWKKTCGKTNTYVISWVHSQSFKTPMIVAFTKPNVK